MQSVVELLLGALPVKLPGVLSGAPGDPASPPGSLLPGQEGASADPFSLLLNSAQYALNPAFDGAAPAGGPFDPELPALPADGAAQAQPLPGMPELSLQQAGLSPVPGNDGEPAATGSPLPLMAAADGRVLPVVDADAADGLLAMPGKVMPAADDASGTGPNRWSRASFGAAAATHAATSSPPTAGEASPAAAAATEQEAADGVTGSRGERLLQTVPRAADGSATVPGPAGVEDPASDASRRAAMLAAGRPAEGAPAAADQLRPAGGETATARVPAAELAMLVAAVEPRSAPERAGQAVGRSGRTETSRTSEPGAERSAAPGAEGFEQQLRAAALRTVAPVTVARDIGMIAERIEMLMHRRGDFANLNLNLGELGDLQISVRMEAKQAHISFVVQDAAVRESLEQQLPRLRSLLEQSGVEVGDLAMDLPRHSGGEQGSNGDRAGSFHARGSGAGAAAAPEDLVPLRRDGDSHHIIDAFA